MNRLELAALEQEARQMRAEEIRRVIRLVLAGIRSIAAKVARRNGARDGKGRVPARV